MKRLLALPLIALMLAPMVAAAQEDHSEHMDHSGHMDHTGHMGHEMSSPAPATPATPEDHSGHQGDGAPSDGPQGSPPVPPKDHAADAFYNRADMEKARKALRYESGGMPASMLLIDRLEWRPGKGADGYAWEGEGWIGGDIDRFTFKTKGEGSFGHSLESAEVQGLWSHAIGPWFNLQTGVRHDIRPQPQRTYAVLGMEGLAPYWFELEGHVFLSDKGDLSARVEASYDQRITQKLIAQPAIELNASAQRVPELGLGSGFNNVELGMRLRYEFVREFAPYIGVHWERKLGDTADYARAAGEHVGGVRFVSGIRFWF